MGAAASSGAGDDPHAGEAADGDGLPPADASAAPVTVAEIAGLGAALEDGESEQERATTLRNLHRIIVERRNLHRSYKRLVLFLTFVVYYVVLLFLQRKAFVAYDINKTLTEYFPKDSNDDPAVKATPETIRDWIKKLVTEVWIDPRCGDGRCETPYEYHSFGRFGCKADCGTLTNVTTVKVSFEVFYPPNVEVGGDIDDTQKDKFLDETTWNLCAPNLVVEGDMLCWFEEDQKFDSHDMKLTVEYDIPDGDWILEVSAPYGGVQARIAVDDGTADGYAVQKKIDFCTETTPGSPPPPTQTSYAILSASFVLIDESLWGSEALATILNSADATYGAPGSSSQVVGVRQSATALFGLGNGTGKWSTQAEEATETAIAADLGLSPDDVEVAYQQASNRRRSLLQDPTSSASLQVTAAKLVNATEALTLGSKLNALPSESGSNMLASLQTLNISDTVGLEQNATVTLTVSISVVLTGTQDVEALSLPVPEAYASNVTVAVDQTGLISPPPPPRPPPAPAPPPSPPPSPSGPSSSWNDDSNDTGSEDDTGSEVDTGSEDDAGSDVDGSNSTDTTNSTDSSNSTSRRRALLSNGATLVPQTDAWRYSDYGGKSCTNGTRMFALIYGPDTGDTLWGFASANETAGVSDVLFQDYTQFDYLTHVYDVCLPPLAAYRDYKFFIEIPVSANSIIAYDLMDKDGCRMQENYRTLEGDPSNVSRDELYLSTLNAPAPSCAAPELLNLLDMSIWSEMENYGVPLLNNGAVRDTLVKPDDVDDFSSAIAKGRVCPSGYQMVYIVTDFYISDATTAMHVLDGSGRLTTYTRHGGNTLWSQQIAEDLVPSDARSSRSGSFDYACFMPGTYLMRALIYEYTDGFLSEEGEMHYYLADESGCAIGDLAATGADAVNAYAYDGIVSINFTVSSTSGSCTKDRPQVVDASTVKRSSSASCPEGKALYQVKMATTDVTEVARLMEYRVHILRGSAAAYTLLGVQAGKLEDRNTYEATWCFDTNATYRLQGVGPNGGSGWRGSAISIVSDDHCVLVDRMEVTPDDAETSSLVSKEVVFKTSTTCTGTLLSIEDRERYCPFADSILQSCASVDISQADHCDYVCRTTGCDFGGYKAFGYSSDENGCCTSNTGALTLPFTVNAYNAADQVLPVSGGNRNRFLGLSNRVVSGMLFHQTRKDVQGCDNRFLHIFPYCPSDSEDTRPFGVDPVFLSTSTMYNEDLEGSKCCQESAWEGKCFPPECGTYYNTTTSKGVPSLNARGIPYGFFHEDLDGVKDGFSVFFDINLSEEQALKFVDVIEYGFFLDQLTSQVTTVIGTYNGVLKYFAYFVVTFTYDEGGTIDVEADVQTVSVELYETTSDMVRLGFEAFFCVLVIFELISELREILDSYFKLGSVAYYFRSFWNYIDILSIIANCLCIVTWVLFQLRTAKDFNVSMAYDVYADYYANARVMKLKNDGEGLRRAMNDLNKIREATDFLNHYMTINGMNVFLLVIRTLNFCDFQPRMGIVTRTLNLAGSDLAHFFLLLLIIITAYSLMAHLLFGTRLEGFSTIWDSFQSCFNMMAFGDTDFSGDLLDNPKLASMGIVFYWSYGILVVLLLMNFLLAIVVDAFGEVKSQAGSAKSIPTELSELFISWIKSKKTQTSDKQLAKAIEALLDAAKPAGGNEHSESADAPVEADDSGLNGKMIERALVNTVTLAHIHRSGAADGMLSEARARELAAIAIDRVEGEGLRSVPGDEDEDPSARLEARLQEMQDAQTKALAAIAAAVEDLAADQRELRAEQSALSAALRNAARAARKTPAAGTAAPGPRRDDD